MYGAAGSIGQQMVKNILPSFEKTRNAKVTYQGMGAAEVLSRNMAQRGKPEASLVVANDTTAAVGTKQGLWQKLDRNLIPSLASLPAWALLDDGHAVATGATAIGIVYNKKIFEEKGFKPPTSWEDLFRDEFAGHVVVYDITFGLMTPVLFSWNLALGGTYEDLTPVFNKFRQNRSKILTIAPQAAAWDQVFQQGIGWIGVNSIARMGILREQGVPLEFVYPKERAVGIFATAMVPVGAPQGELGQRLLDHHLQPDVQAIFASTQYYAPVNPAAKLDPKVLQILPDQKQMKNLFFPDWLKLQENLPKATQQWQRTVVNR
jgi:putative spermidine/putrescine transport system substrate-binding protein